MLHLGLLQHGLSLRRLLLPLLLQVRILALATYNTRVCLGTILKRADRAHPWLRTATNRGLTWATATNMTRACIATALAELLWREGRVNIRVIQMFENPHDSHVRSSIACRKDSTLSTHQRHTLHRDLRNHVFVWWFPRWRRGRHLELAGQAASAWVLPDPG